MTGRMKLEDARERGNKDQVHRLRQRVAAVLRGMTAISFSEGAARLLRDGEKERADESRAKY